MSSHYIISIPLYVSPHAYTVLEKRFEIARQLYNCFLGECERRRRRSRNSQEFNEAVGIYGDLKSLEGLKAKGEDHKHLQQKAKALAKRQQELFSAARDKAGYYLQNASQYGKTDSLESFAARVTKGTWLTEHVDSHVRNKLAERAFIASMRKGKRLDTKVYFRRRNEPLLSVEAKQADRSIHHKVINNQHCVFWQSDLWMPFLESALNDEKIKPLLSGEANVKYWRLSRSLVRGRWRYVAQAVCQGVPVRKKRHHLGVGSIGADLGPSSLAAVSDEDAQLIPTCNFSGNNAFNDLCRLERVVLRRIDRQRRDSNPENYNSDRTVKKGARKWKCSNRQKNNELKLKDLQRRLKEYRNCSHGKIANDLRTSGNLLKIDADRYSTWQQTGYGRSIAKFAPGLLVSKLQHKFDCTGGEVIRIDTRKSKSSQTCPCGHQEKKGKAEGKDNRSVRIHKCSKCGYEMQRDLVSAVINKFMDGDILDVDKSKRFVKEQEPLLRTCVERIIQSAREGQQLPSTFGKLSELERIVRK